VSVSIVIPTTMRRQTVEPVAAAAVRAVSPLDGEVILVPNGPTEGRRSPEIRSPRLRVLECPVPKQSVARNLGLREARNDVVLFTDDDCVLVPDWPLRLAQRLRSGDIAVATPLKNRRYGSVTTFLDYQRIYHPRPIDGSTVDYGLGASIGVRRDLVGHSFDDAMGPGDDVEFGCTLRDAGISIAYAPEAPAPLHLLPERLETITGRFIRYGTSNAKLFLRKGRPQFSIPHVTSLYSSVCRNEIAAPRRFEEIADPELRELFGSFELILVGSTLIGYLGEVGRILDRELINLDRDALDAGWNELERRLDEGFTRERDWGRLPVDFERWLTPREGRRPAFAAAVAENLSRNAGLTEEPRFDPDLDRHADEIARRADDVWHSANEILADLRQGRLPARADPIAWRLREAGIAFREGAQMIEIIAQGPVQPAPAPAIG
jgi:glycosyltransferase involved in cell wall biosynthesis